MTAMFIAPTNLLLFYAIFTCALTLVLSIYPGVLNGFLGFMAIAFLWLILLAACAIAGIKLWFRRKEPSLKSEFQRLTITLLILIVSYSLLKFYVPRRIGFFFSRPAFVQWLAKNPSKTNQPRLIETKLGIYQVDEYASSSDGGNYFRVYSHGDGLGPDTVSYGFAYQPNSQTSPFGAANYHIYPLGDGWYWFQASNDW